MQEQELSFRMVMDYIFVLWKKKIQVLIYGSILGTILSFVVFGLPDIYESYTLIFVERQKVPESYVKSAVSEDIGGRLDTLKQQITSRTNIKKIIEEFNLASVEDYSSNTYKLYFSKFAKKAKKLFGIPDEPKKPDEDELINSVIGNIAVLTQGKGREAISSFKISYQGRNPEKVMRITNKLSSLIIEENLKIREQMVEGTSSFLENELEAQKSVLEEKEKALSTYKSKNMGRLPTQLQSNLQSLTRIQLELASVEESLIKLNENKFNTEQALLQLEEELRQKKADNEVRVQSTLNSSNAGQSLAAQADNKEITLTPSEIKYLQTKAALDQLSSEYTDVYPDIILLKSQLAKLEGDIKRERAERDAFLKSADKGRKSGAAEKQTFAITDPVFKTEVGKVNERIAQLKAAIATYETEINVFQLKKKSLNNDMKGYGQRVEDTPKLEQELAILERDYGNIKSNYEALLEKKLNAKISENLEKRQKGEQFRIIDPAFLPIKPVKPKRGLLLAGSWIFSLCFGAGIVLLGEKIKSTFKRVDEIEELIQPSFVVTIPFIKTDKKSVSK